MDDVKKMLDGLMSKDEEQVGRWSLGAFMRVLWEFSVRRGRSEDRGVCWRASQRGRPLAGEVPVHCRLQDCLQQDGHQQQGGGGGGPEEEERGDEGARKRLLQDRKVPASGGILHQCIAAV